MILSTQIITLIILLFLSGFFSGSEVALISLAKHRVMQMIENKKLGAGFIKKLKDNPQRMLATILIGNNLVNIAAASMMTAITIEIFQSYAVAIATGITTFLILVFGEIIPKSGAIKHNETIAQLTAAPIWYLGVILSPILLILDKLVTITGMKAKEPAITEEEIISMVNVAKKEGSIKEIEKKMIHKIFKFDDINASEIATPKTDMVVIPLKSKIDDAITLMQKKKYSRIPVYEKQKDNIVGVIYAKDLINYIKRRKNMEISKIMKKPYFVPETKKISNLLRRFQKRKEQMAIIVDEHGSITGLVTLEDVLEEIVGEIMDETEKLTPHIKKIKKNSWIVNGKTDIDEVNEKLNMKIAEKNRYDTFSGFILHQTGKIPKEGDEITYNKFKLKIEDKEGNRISKVRVEKV